MTRDPLAAFDDAIITSVAQEFEYPESDLRAIARSHQEGVRDLPGVDDIVYEWRTQFHQDPLVDRTDVAYVLAVQGHVWEEFGGSLDTNADELDVLLALHDQQARELTGQHDRFDTDDGLVLTRP